MYNLFKRVAFSLDAEVAHHLSIKTLSIFPKIAASFFTKHSKEIESGKYAIELNGNKWMFPIGLAAGLDKNAESVDFFASLPFGAIEVGTVTPLPQVGNDKPRLFRLKEDFSLRNRMGFNNEGMEFVFHNVINSQKNGKVLGVNLGKNKITEQEKAADDYLKLYENFHSVCDYLVINISSPNTPGLRDLQNTAELKNIFEKLVEVRKKSNTPLYLKISPDLSTEDIPDIVDLCCEYQLSGIIATNTTIMPEKGEGGVSGRLIKDRSALIRNKVLEVIKSKQVNLDVIGVGGVDSFEDLLQFWQAGGKAMQLYTSFIYHGPQVLFDIKEGIDRELKKKNCDNVTALIKKIQS